MAQDATPNLPIIPAANISKETSSACIRTCPILKHFQTPRLLIGIVLFLLYYFPLTGEWTDRACSDALSLDLAAGNRVMHKKSVTGAPNPDHLQCIFQPADVSQYSLLDIMETLFVERLQTGDQPLRRACIERIEDLIYDTYPPINPDAERTYHTMVFKAIMEIKHTTVTQGAVVWQIQNHGFVIKTPSVTLGFDLYDYYNYQEFSILADLLDVYFISHGHRDHFSPLLIDAMHRLGKPVVGPVELADTPDFENVSIRMNAGDNLTISGCTVTAHDGGDHSVPVRMYEVVTPEGLLLLHTGDKEYTTTLPIVSDIDILMFNAWISIPAPERTDETRIEGILATVNLYQPQVAFAGHAIELGHLQYMSPTNPTWPLYHNAYSAGDSSLLSEYRIPAWGERYQYGGPLDVILPNAVENLACQIRQDTVIVSWDPPQPASDGETATFYRIIVNDTCDHWVDETEFRHFAGSDFYFKVYAYDRCGNQSEQYREITGNANVSEFTLHIPRADTPPAIDGIMDPVWYSVCTTPMEKPNLTLETAPDNWLDCYAGFKMMYDADNVYLFIQAHDDQINTSNAQPYYNDCFEIYFDGDNSKNDAATGYDNNDVQLRYSYGQTTEKSGNAPHSTCAFINTDYGYNLEIRIPTGDMTFNLNPDHSFGFDIAMIDNDSGERDHFLMMWQGNMLYLYAEVFDDIINTSHAEPYMNDGFEVFIDGNNDKTSSTDENDARFSLVCSTTPAGDQVFTQTASGWTVEARLDLGAATGMTVSSGKLMGFELSLNDNDGNGRDLCSHWRHDDAMSWANPGLLGTIQFTGTAVTVDKPHKKSIPQAFHLAQNFPNPFNPVTRINYQLPITSEVDLSIYNLLGQKIITLISEQQAPGRYTIEWNAGNVTSGIYIYRLQAGEFTATKKLVMQK